MIVGFNDAKYFFLNNKYSCNVFVLERRFGNAEAAYQAHKTKEPQIINIFTTLDAVSSQSIGRGVDTYDGWKDNKVKAMLLVVFEKFRQNPDILEKLLETENQKLVAVSISEENFWGIRDDMGENILGKILMYVREYFKTHTKTERERLYSDWEDVQSELKLFRSPIKSYGMLYSEMDINRCNSIFNDCLQRIEKLKLEIENFIQFFLVDVDILTEATKQFTE